MPTPKANSARRRDVRRAVPRDRPAWKGAVQRPELLVALGFATLLAAGAWVLGTLGQHRQTFHSGMTLVEPAVARVGFETRNTPETEQNRKSAYANQAPVYRHHAEYYQEVRVWLEELIQDIADKPAETQSIYAEDGLTAKGVDSLQNYIQDGQAKPEWNALIDGLLRKLFETTILPSEDMQTLQGQGHYALIKVHPRPHEGTSAERRVRHTAWVPLTDGKGITDAIRRSALEFPHQARDFIVSHLSKNLQPTFLYDEEATRVRAQLALEAVPDVIDRYFAGDVLVERFTRLDADHVEILTAEAQAFEQDRNPAQRWALMIARLAIFGLIAAGVWTYIFQYGPRIRRNPWRGFAVTALMLLCQAAGVLTAMIWPDFLFGAVTYPVLLMGMVLAIAYDQRLALGLSTGLVLIILISLSLPVTTGLVMLTGVAVVVALLREVRSRSRLVTAGTWAGLAMAAAAVATTLASRPIFAEELTLRHELLTVLSECVIAVIAASFFTGITVQGILPAIEYVFHITTPMKLRMYNDANHPLLRRLAQEAPGTYQHSLRIADMAEAAADAIGGDGLLCRVGAMYHDIGKMNKPGYFIENQGGGPNRHEKLSPAMSLLIIVGHVKDGVEMAREFALPLSIRHFIESHHGTTLVEYFYHEAKKQTEAQDKPGPSEFEFRYPGPKPQTKEAAIMLLCDSLEAAARSLPEPTPVRLEQLVERMAQKRLMDGQFDECDMTLRDLAKIEQAITKTLCAVYHTRIKYPGDQDDNAQTDARPSAPRAASIAAS